jgi:hypothetical protein
VTGVAFSLPLSTARAQQKRCARLRRGD